MMKRSVILAMLLAMLTLSYGFAFADVQENGSAATAAPTITAEPEDVIAFSSESYNDFGEIVTCPVKKSAVFSVCANGGGLSYQWYYRASPQDDWEALRNHNLNVLYFPSCIEMDGGQVYCVVSNNKGEKASRVANITFLPQIRSCSCRVEGEVGETVNISVQAVGNNLSYQWYYRKSRTDDWIIWKDKTEPKFDLKLTKEMDGRYFNCVVTDGKGRTASICDWVNPYITVKEPLSSVDSEITLYFIDEFYIEKLSLPDGYQQSYTLSGHSLKRVSGDSVSISGSTITPYEISTISGSKIYRTYRAGDSIVRVDNSKNILVHVKDYAAIYAERVMDEYMAKNITDDMTEYQKAEKCCQFVANYNYDVSYQDYIGLVVMGGGDCWSSVSTLEYMTAKLGIQAIRQYVGNLYGLSGHYTIYAKLNGLYYIVETGFSGTAPRRYELELQNTIFAYSKLSNGEISIKSFINVDGASEIEIPSAIDGHVVSRIGDRAFEAQYALKRVTIPDTVTSIGEYAFYGCKYLEEIEIPQSVTSIGDYAFYLCYALKRLDLPKGLMSIGENAFCQCDAIPSVNIPASVMSIGMGAFQFCENLKAVNVDSKNRYYMSIDGVLFSGNGQVLHSFPAGRHGSYAVPEGIIGIGERAFSTASLDRLELPSSLQWLAEGAFYETDLNERLIMPESLTEIGDYAFYDAYISEIELPEKLKRIGEGSFYSSNLEVLTLPKGLESIGESAFAGCYSLKRVHIPASVKEIGKNAFRGSSWEENENGRIGRTFITFAEGCNPTFADNVFRDVALGVYQDTSPHTHAVNNNIPFVLLGEDDKITIESKWFGDITEPLRFTGEALEPQIEISGDPLPFSLIWNRDIRALYSNNIEPGKAKVKIYGIGDFTGTVTRTFEIRVEGHRVRFDSCGGSYISSLYDVFYGKAYGELETPTYKGCKFIGWFTEKDGGECVTAESICKSAGDETLYAHWEVGDINGDSVVNVIDHLMFKLGHVPTKVLYLPDAATTIQAEAFAGVPAEVVFVPSSVKSIADNAFSTDVILVISPGTLEKWAEEHGFAYVLIQ